MKMNNDNIAISIENLEKSFKSKKVLNDISFTVKTGSIFALLGSNGAGKTTIIKILTTILKPDKGNIKVGGFDVLKNANDVKKTISLNAQSLSVDYVLTARENLELIAKLRHIKNAKQEIDSLLKQFDLKDVENQSIKTFSGGMLRKLDLAMSLIGDPSIIFLDEPTTGLDPQSRIVMWEVIKKLAEKGKTIFLTTQYLEEAEKLADNIVILDKGKIVKNGTVQELKKLFESEKVTFVFEDQNSFDNSKKLFENYKINMNEENLSVEIIINGNIKQISDIFKMVAESNIMVSDFYKKQPTLEDIFLSTIGIKGDS